MCYVYVCVYMLCDIVSDDSMHTLPPVLTMGGRKKSPYRAAYRAGVVSALSKYKKYKKKIIKYTATI